MTKRDLERSLRRAIKSAILEADGPRLDGFVCLVSYRTRGGTKSNDLMATFGNRHICEGLIQEAAEELETEEPDEEIIQGDSEDEES